MIIVTVPRWANVYANPRKITWCVRMKPLHDKWFREQVRQGLVDANDPNIAWVTHEVAKENMQRQREVLQARIADKANNAIAMNVVCTTVADNSRKN